jgi:hypothetical protein
VCLERVRGLASALFLPRACDELLLHKIAIDRIIELHLTVREMYGSALSYTAKPPVDAVPSSAGFIEVIRVHRPQMDAHFAV